MLKSYHVYPLKIFLDDEKDPAKFAGELNLDGKWWWVKTVYEFIALVRNALNHHIRIEEISFDHDLGDKHEGDVALKFIEKLCYEGIMLPPKMRCHSSNPSGRIKIESGIARLYEVFGEPK